MDIIEILDALWKVGVAAGGLTYSAQRVTEALKPLAKLTPSKKDDEILHAISHALGTAKEAVDKQLSDNPFGDKKAEVHRKVELPEKKL